MVPYRIKEHVLRQKVVLERNPDWTGDTYDFDEIHAVVVEGGDAGELAFEAGELDVTPIASTSIPRYTTEEPLKDGSVVVAGNLQYAWVGMNTEHPKLQDIRVRQAIQHAINMEQVQALGFRGVAEQAHGIVPPGLPGRRTESGYSYDPDRARELLAEAGVEDLELTIVTQNSKRERLLAAQVMQQNLAEVGITLEVLPLESGQFWSWGREEKADTWKDSQLWIMRFGGNVDPSDYFQWFVADQVGNWNWERWTNPEFDELYEKARIETDIEVRTAMYLRMQELMEETGAYVWLNHEPEAFLHRNNVDPGIDPTGVYLLHGSKRA